MKRKNVVGLVALVAIVAAVIFAGCVEEETPVPTPSPTATPLPKTTPTPEVPTATPTPEPTVSNIYASDETAMRKIRTALTDHGLHSVSTQAADGRDKGGVKVLILSYKSTALTEDDLAEETGSILGAYLGIVEMGGDFDELSVVVGDTSGNAIGMWYCNKDWTNKYIIIQ
jgi:hypothetical protein